jgi:hypothetical protein
MIEETLPWVGKQDQLRQGDIIKINHCEGTRKPFELGVIINADCDLANNKTDGVIAFLPIYSFEDYLIEFWLPRFISEKKKDFVSKVKEMSSKWSDNNIIESDLIEWLSDTTELQISQVIESLVKGLCCPKNKSSDLEEILYKLYFSIKTENQKSLKIVRKLLSKSLHNSEIEQEKDKGKRKAEEEKELQKKFNSAKKEMGDSYFFLSEIKGEEKIGFVVSMRRIYSLEEVNCFQSESDLRISRKSDYGCAFRIARLSPHYKFKLAQLFAYQYSRIGLPDEITALSEVVISEMCNIALED